MKDLKSGVIVFSMVLLIMVIGVMLWNKNNTSRIEELTYITDYIDKVKFKHQREQNESEFIKQSIILERKLLTSKKDASLNADILSIKAKSLSLAPLGNKLSFTNKIILLECLESIVQNSTNNESCTTNYAKKSVIKGS